MTNQVTNHSSETHLFT